MGLRLQRHLGEVGSIEPGQFCIVETEHMAGRVVRFHICCPGCGGVDELSRHVVQRHSGKVTPSWKCPTATCGVWEWLELDSLEAV